MQRPIGYVLLTLEFKKDGRRWLGQCRELGTATFARSLDQVKAELEELVTLHLNALDDTGERSRFFAEHGIRLYPVEEQPTQVERTLQVARSNFEDGWMTLVQARPIEVEDPASKRKLALA